MDFQKLYTFFLKTGGWWGIPRVVSCLEGPNTSGTISHTFINNFFVSQYYYLYYKYSLLKCISFFCSFLYKGLQEKWSKIIAMYYQCSQHFKTKIKAGYSRTQSTSLRAVTVGRSSIKKWAQSSKNWCQLHQSLSWRTFVIWNIRFEVSIRKQ